MGCDSSNYKDKRQNRSRGGQNNKRKIKPLKLATADLESSRQSEAKETDERVEILKRGVKKELKSMIENYNDDINEYTFGQNRTLLLEAVIVCPNPNVVNLIMDKGADIDKEELQTGNTALFLSALDLKVDFVRNLLKYEPNLDHKNHAGQNIFDFLNYQLFEQRQKIGREMSQEENEKYEQIEQMLREQAG